RADEADRLRREADDQRTRAEARFRDAREAVDHMLTRVGQEQLAYEPRMEQVRRDLLEKAAGFYERFLKEDGDHPSVRLEAARAAHKVGEIRAFLGQHEAAEKAYRRALALLNELTEAEPGRADYRKELAAASYSLGNLLKDTGRREAARPAYARAAA